MSFVQAMARRPLAFAPMAFGLPGPDARLIQIGVLASLLLLGVFRFDLAATPLQAAITIAAALVTQSIFDFARSRPVEWRSALITGLSLTLLLRSHDPLFWALAGMIGIGAKALFRLRGKHLFNPACIALVSLLFATGQVWVTPGQWSGLVLGGAALASAAGLLLARVDRIDIAAAFLAGYAGLLAVRCLALGDPWTIPVHQLQSGALLIFAFFMITDPRSTPDARLGRVLFALAVAALAHWLQFVWQIREGLFYALALLAPVTPFLDILLPGPRFGWNSSRQES